jgi:mono/diheme cytochrome c family protein
LVASAAAAYPAALPIPARAEILRIVNGAARMTNLTSKRAAAGAGLAAMALMLWAAPPGVAAGAADAAHGEQLAKRWCASCHIVASDQTHGADDAPAFATIAKRPGFSEDAVARFLILMDPHPKMPDMQLGRGEAKDLAAYIASQAR